MTEAVWGYSLVHSSISLVCMSIFMPVAHHFVTMALEYILKLGIVLQLAMFTFLQGCFGNVGSFMLPCEFQDGFFF